MNVNILETALCEGLVAHRLRTRCLLTGLYTYCLQRKPGHFLHCLLHTGEGPVSRVLTFFCFPFLPYPWFVSWLWARYWVLGTKEEVGCNFFPPRIWRFVKKGCRVVNTEKDKSNDIY